MAALCRSWQASFKRISPKGQRAPTEAATPSAMVRGAMETAVQFTPMPGRASASRAARSRATRPRAARAARGAQAATDASNGFGGNGNGGAIYTLSSAFSLSFSSFSGDLAEGGNGGFGEGTLTRPMDGPATGPAAQSLASPHATVHLHVFTGQLRGRVRRGRRRGKWRRGWAQTAPAGRASAERSAVSARRLSQLRRVVSMLTWPRRAPAATPGAGGDGGSGNFCVGGAIETLFGDLDVSDSTFSEHPGRHGATPAPAEPAVAGEQEGFSPAASSSRTINFTLTGSTFVGNQAIAGSGGSGG